ncbi:MAG: TetR/AcrR family transcriptional regulator [Actinomycetia bacterium]|nr:TetR/AcrR family transcriptional regulator [Actinomycetes bacterium]
MSEEVKVGVQRPGGRAARVQAAILQATTELLVEVGYERLTFEDVATRAGVHKTTVWRRWSTKAALVADATRLRSEQHVPIPDTGSLQGDFQSLAREVAANIGSDIGARMGRSLVSAAATSTELATELHEFWAHRFTLTAPIIDRAIERGELPPDADKNLLVEALIGPLWARLLLTGEEITPNIADSVATIVATGATAAVTKNRPSLMAASDPTVNDSAETF